MKILTYGNPENEKILLLHPMFTDAHFFDFSIDKWIDHYYLIIPTYKGHDEYSTYISIEDEEKSIDLFLQENHITHLKVVIGFSLGGNIAFHYFCHHSNCVDQVIIDSAPLFQFPNIVKKYFYNKYKKCLIQIRKHPEKKVETLNKCFHGMGEDQQYVAPIVTLESLKNLVESCYHNPMPKLDIVSQRKMTFVYGTKDIARFCIPRIKKYKDSQIVQISSLNHCDYFRKNIDDYIKQLIRH
ncbi:MAG: alpha/beta hydrolase [Prevotella sp.]|nr:alpha/beta hydrolase [Staphylococcus sp.]MCM1350838.1 alpha/beta hydrolase [Prevotella sp.]